MLEKFIDEETVKAEVKADDWEEAVKESGKLLLKKGSIENCYIDKMIQNVKELGPYMVVAPGIAITHARPTDGVKFTGISIMTLKKPVPFGNSEFDPVKLVISVAAYDSYEHIGALKELADIIKSPAKTREIFSASSDTELYKLFIV